MIPRIMLMQWLHQDDTAASAPILTLVREGDMEGAEYDSVNDYDAMAA